MSQQQKLKWPDAICSDFTTQDGKVIKGCGQQITWQKIPGEFKENGKPKYRKANTDGSPHTHNVSRQGTMRLEDVKGPTSNPNATPNTLMLESRVSGLEKQLATLTQEYDGVRLRLDALEKGRVQQDVDEITNASEDELGEESAE